MKPFVSRGVYWAAAMPLAGTGNDILILAVLLFAALFGLYLAVFDSKAPRRSRFRGYSPRAGNFQGGPNNAMQHFGQQLQSVMMSSFEKRRIMNASEYRTFHAVENEVASMRNGHRVFAQTSLGEILQSNNEEAFHSINSKRVDILIVDRGGWPVLAVEYQGEGHYKGTAAARDAIKKEALRKAGVRYLEVVPDDNEEQIRRRVSEHLNSDKPLPPSPSPARSGFGLRTAAH